MAQYNAGSIDVTNGSQVVTGNNTLWLVNLSVGDILTILNSAVWYEVATVDSDTQVTLTANYAGVTATSQQYTVTRDFTPTLGLPYPVTGDLETAAIIKRAFLDLDAGITITSLTHKGDWLVGTTYVTDDAALSGGRYFRSKVNANIGNLPPATGTGDSFWALLADKGAVGATGAAGSTVLNGAVDPTTEGVDGDFYINTAAITIFGPKATGSWGTGTSIVGAQGIQGQSVDHVTLTSGTGAAGTTDTYTVWGDAGATINLGTFTVLNGATGAQGIQGQSVDHVTLTSGTGAAGTTDTYTVWGDAGATINLGTFTVLNGATGAQGQSVDHVTRTAGNGAAGTTDTYTIWGDAGATINLGTFTVLNGADGAGVGDMTVATYDPTSQAQDIFAYAQAQAAAMAIALG